LRSSLFGFRITLRGAAFSDDIVDHEFENMAIIALT
jgi:hypothetical protein